MNPTYILSLQLMSTAVIGARATDPVLPDRPRLRRAPR